MVSPEVNTQFQEILFSPGINKNNTPYGNEGGWIDGDKVRFRNQRPRKIGGWQNQTTDTVTGVARDVISWSSLSADKYLGVATHKKVEIFFGGEFNDITPIRSTISSTSAISTSSGSNQVQVLVSSHDAQVGDDIVLYSTASVGNVLLNGTYPITSVVNTNNLLITYTTVASNTVATSATVSGYLLLQNGLEYNQVALGWSAGAWGTGTWGTPRTASSLISEMRQWSLSNWGEDLVACNRGGALYSWDETSGVTARMNVIAGAPSQNNAIIVSYPTRHLVTFGTTEQATSIYDPLLVRWCSSENYNDWNVSAAGTAGFKRLEKGNRLMGAEPSKNDVLVFTDTAAYSMRNVDYPDIFTFDLIGQGCGIVSPHAAINIDGVVYWMSDSAFYRYDGSLRTLSCTMRDVLFDALNEQGLNQSQRDMVFCGLNQEFNEIIWFYPSRDSTQCDRYVMYNYLEDSWYDGSMDRSVWEGTNIFDKPLALSRDGVLYAHELGYDDDGAPMDSWIQSGMFDLDKGDEIMFIDRFIPDFNLQGNLSLEFTTRKYPQSGSAVTKTYTIAPGAGKVSVRARGRQASVKFQSNTTNGNYIMGKPRFSLKSDGAQE
jgi:hypothetical protein